MIHISYFLLGAAGAATLEALRLYELQGRLPPDKFNALTKSRWFWAVILFMTVASGFIAWAFHVSCGSVETWQLVATGIATPSILRQSARSHLDNKPFVLGGNSGVAQVYRVSLRDILG